MSKKKKKKSFFKYILRIIIIFVIFAAAYMAYFMFEKVNGVKSIFQNIEDTRASLTEYIVYGTHLNMKGNLNIEKTDIESVKLCFKTVDEEKNKEIGLKYEKTTNGINFYTSDLINEGIYLEDIDEETYYLFLKVGYKDEVYKYYSMNNETKYENVDYYTITRNEKNNKIEIAFSTYNMSGKIIDYMYINVRYSKLPDEVYDIVIDPGHGRKRCWRRSEWISRSKYCFKIWSKNKEGIRKFRT